MTLVSKNEYKYSDFNWNLYSHIYNNLVKEGYDTKEKLWWHFLNIGEKNGYKFFNIKEYHFYLEKYNNFDDYVYAVFMDRTYKKNLKKDGYITKDQLWWHYITKNNEMSYFNIQERNTNLTKLFRTDKEPKKTIYYLCT